MHTPTAISSLYRLRTVSITSDTSSLSPSSSTPSSVSPRYYNSEHGLATVLNDDTAMSNVPRTPKAHANPASTSWSSPMLMSPETWTLPCNQAGRVIRKSKSKVEIRQQEERQQIRGDLLGLIEPRPFAGVALSGIEEVLHGDA